MYYQSDNNNYVFCAGTAPISKSQLTTPSVGKSPSPVESEETVESESSKSMGSYHLEQAQSINEMSVVAEEAEPAIPGRREPLL